MAKNNRVKKNVRDVKGGTPQSTLEIDPGNVPILTIKLLNQINNNIVKLINIAEDNERS